jgi:hypothetical protein
MYNDKDIKRFWSKTEQHSNGCILWVAGQCGDGYGWFSLKGKGIKAHRFSWQLANLREIPPGMVIRHKCDTPTCVNPNCLDIGTPKDNMRDMDSRGRRASIVGKNNPWARLTIERVNALRELHNGGASYRLLALAAGVKKATIAHLISGRTWN